MAGKWKCGRVVRLKSSPKPKMTVHSDGSTLVECDWFDDNGEPRMKVFHENELEAADDESIPTEEI